MNRALLAAIGLTASALAYSEDYSYYQDRAARYPQENFVLGQMEMGLAALREDRRESATQHLDSVVNLIDAIWSGSESAEKARSLWYSEGSKDFRGEPYERAMAFYYRALIDLMNADYDNALAGFKGASLQDAFAEEQQNRSDFAVMTYLQAWAAKLEGLANASSELIIETKALRQSIDDFEPDNNVIVIAESGKAPRKLADGVGQNILVYRRGKRFNDLGVQIAELEIKLTPIEDVYWQASSRGGRPIDRVLDGQAQFKAAADTTGSVLGEVSSVASSYNTVLGNSQQASGAFAAVGVAAGLVQLAGSRVNASADTRYWSNLPDGIHVRAITLPRDVETLTLEFTDIRGNPVPGMRVTSRVNWDRNGNGLVWVKSWGRE